jgi:hypothetical protein
MIDGGLAMAVLLGLAFNGGLTWQSADTLTTIVLVCSGGKQA